MSDPPHPTNAASNLSPAEIRSRLIDHFGATPGADRGSKWDDLWKTNFVPWDQGAPNPALVDLLDPSHPKHATIPGPVELDDAGKMVRRRKVLVPGCGRGYDALLFAAKGYDAVGLEYSVKALEECLAERKRAEEKGWDVYKAGKHGKGEIRFVQGDFYTTEWQTEQRWDIIYDYTFLCAMDPTMRPPWAKRMSELLEDDGRLVCLEFPLTKPPTSGGPPFGLTPEIYIAHLSRPGADIPYGEDGTPKEDELNKLPQSDTTPLERIERWKPERSSELGEGTDVVSIWKKVGGRKASL